ncbi:protein TIFY 6B-like [Bidens hawaiensis]|uniref:protein TIFY 6B-like n=1 Tax=Bidens hawaiensis TaxID=980011 RepID=UPI00404A1B9D
MFVAYVFIYYFLKSIGKQAVPISVSHPFYRALSKFDSASFKQHGVAVPSPGFCLAGTTEHWYNNSKVSCAPAQLTIFYGRMVNVYDDISLEKVYKLIFYCSTYYVVGGASTSTPQAKVQAQVPVSGTPVGNVVYVTQPVNPQPCLAISSPMSVSSHPLGPTYKDEGATTFGGSCLHVSKADCSRVISSLEEVMKSTVAHD